MSNRDLPAGVHVDAPMHDGYDEVLTPEALGFLADLPHLRRAPARTARASRVQRLNSGARVWLADHEDANTPMRENMVEGQLKPSRVSSNLRDAIERRIDFTSPEGKSYALEDDVATIVVRPRGWHLPEKHVLVDGERMAGSLFDFGLYFFHCAQAQIERGHGPYFYLPKLESHLEARVWNDVLVRAQEHVGIPRGTIRATVLIETYPAAFEMEEILYELREHSAGLNAGRWDYMFSVIKSFRSRGRDFLLPDRSSVTMTVPFMRAYTELLVHTCHKRGAHAIGGQREEVRELVGQRHLPRTNGCRRPTLRDR